MPLNVCTLLLAEGPSLSLEELRDFVAERIKVLPDLLRQRIVRLPGRRARWGWTVDPDLTIDDLVRERLLPPGSGRAGLRAALGELVGSPVPVSAPPWQLWLLHGQDDGFALLYRASHVHQDGAAKNLMIATLFGADSAPSYGTEPARWHPQGRPGPRALGAAIHRTGQWLAPTPAPAALTGPAGGMTHSWVSTPLRRLQAIGLAGGATVNDVFLAVLAGALRAWLADDDGPSSDVGATMAVSTRRPAEHRLLGNYVAGARVLLPCSVEAPVERLAAVRARTVQLKRGGHLGIGERLLFDALPARLRRHVLARGLGTRSAALSLSNVFTPSGPPRWRAAPCIMLCQYRHCSRGSASRSISVVSMVSPASVRRSAAPCMGWRIPPSGGWPSCVSSRSRWGCPPPDRAGRLSPLADRVGITRPHRTGQ
ncbi:hypothetical protein BBK14_27660 [Parafrankia soli]|uniref:O-acyltransferase WSD1-like N-terminal domain-containing protein n=2 Tax=Parafrankia soli TaxID=2599596 RepID=A0A1S1PKJ2_9ACTN|nr:hypothetical protein BBK14_27660 [Parafrankia soli]